MHQLLERRNLRHDPITFNFVPKRFYFGKGRGDFTHKIKVEVSNHDGLKYHFKFDLLLHLILKYHFLALGPRSLTDLFWLYDLDPEVPFFGFRI